MKKRLCTIVALNVMTLSSAPASADGKTFPGAFCDANQAATSAGSPYGFAGTGGGRPPDQTIFGGLFNTANVQNLFSCPIVRDITKGQPDGINFARVHVLNRSRVTCTLFSRTKTSPTAMPTTVEFASDSTTEIGDQQLDYPALDSGLRGYYHFGCDIPPPNPSQGGVSGIWFYDVSEKD
ncbi:MAG: hypothetical protein H7X91_04355 [Burkholderiales bacterium]|nr:hypothetical protein [Burkholderiales bacterium]